MFTKVCFLVLAVVAAGNPDTCAASPGGCAAKTEADANTLMQTRVRIGGDLAPEADEESPLGIAGADFDEMGLLEAGGTEPTEHVEGGVEIGPVELDDNDGGVLDYADDPTLNPYLEELLEMDKVAELEEEAMEDARDWGAYVTDEASDPSKPKPSAKAYATALKEALAKPEDEAMEVKKHPRPGDIEGHAASMLGDSMLV